MAPYFDPWHRQWQNGRHIAERSYSTPGEFYANIRLENGPSKTSHKGLYTAEELVHELEEEQEV